MLACNPFANRKEVEPSKLAVIFLESEPAKEIRQKVLAVKADPEELRIEWREMYIYFPNGVARPKLSVPTIERILKMASTGRNWNSVRQLLGMATAMEASGAGTREKDKK